MKIGKKRTTKEKEFIYHGLLEHKKVELIA